MLEDIIESYVSRLGLLQKKLNAMSGKKATTYM